MPFRSRTKKICKKIHYGDVTMTSSAFDPIMYSHLVDLHLSMIPAEFRYNWISYKEITEGGANGPPQVVQHQKSPGKIGLRVFIFHCLITV